jgi:hypothetical protein
MRVLDVIGLDTRWTFRYPALASVGTGVLLLFESEDGTIPPAGSLVRIERRDGTVAAYEVSFSEVRPGSLGVAISGLGATEVAIGANVEW